MTGKIVPLAWRARRRTCEICNTWNQVPIIGKLGGGLSIEHKDLLGKPDFLIDALLPATIRQRHQIAKLDYGGGIVYASCRRCGASLMDQRYLYGKVIEIPVFSVTLSTDILDAIDAPYAFDYWQIEDSC